jgi:hypothetical protein
MSDPLPAPAFHLVYDVSLTDIGSGYAAGIAQSPKGQGNFRGEGILPNANRTGTRGASLVSPSDPTARP